MPSSSQPKRDVRDEHRACRTFNHAWDFTTVKRDGRNWVQGLRCMRCGTERTQAVDGYGFIIGNKYDYPDGYLMDGGGALTQKERARLRLGEIKVHSQPSLFESEAEEATEGPPIEKAAKPRARRSRGQKASVK